MISLDVDTAVTVPVNVMPLLDDTDFKTRETAIAYNAAGMDLVWNFITSAGVITQTAVTPTTSGVYDWTHVGDGMYKIEIPASGGGSINNDTEGYGWFSGVVTGVLPFRGPTIRFRAAALNDALCDGGDVLDVNLTQWLGTAAATPTVAGVPEVDVTHVGGSAEDLPTATALATAQTDLDTLTGSDGVTLATSQPNYAPNTTTPLDAAGVRTAVGLASANLDTQLGDIDTDIQTLLGRITSTLFSGITSLAEWLGAMAGKQTANSTARTEIRATGAGSGTFDETTESLEALRDRGDAAWTTGAGGSPPDLLVSTTIATLSSQTNFTLTAGSTDNDAYNGAKIVVTDQSTSTQKAVGWISDYAGGTKTVVLESDPGIFTMAVGDSVDIIAVAKQLDIAVSDAPADWSTTERNQIRYRLQLDGTQGAPASDDPTQLPVDVQALDGTEQDATDLADFAAQGYDPGTNRVQFVATVDSTTSNADYVTPPTVAQIADQVWEEDLSAHSGTSGSTAEALDGAGGGGSAPTAGEVADAVWDEALSGHTTAGTAGERLGRVPNAAAGGNGGLPTVDASNYVAGVQGTKNTLDDLTDVTAAQILAAGDVDGYSVEETLKICLAALAGKLSGGGTTTITIRAADDSKARITATVDANGNRSAVTLDETG